MSFSQQTRLLVVAPHPDDETIATGLLIQQVLAAGGEVSVLLLTSGDNNPWPQRWLERRWRIGDVGRQRWGLRRHAEVVQALRSLGVAESALHSLAWPDLGVTDRLLRMPRQAVSAVADVITAFRPSLIAFPALGDHHPDHSAAHVLVRLALREHAETPQLLAYWVHGTRLSREGIEIHGTDAQRLGKRTALSAHRTQLALSRKRLYRLADGPEQYVDVSDDALATSRLPWQPSVALRPWLRLSVVSSTGAQSFRWADAPLQRDDHGAYEFVSAAAGVCFVKLTLQVPSPWIFDHWGWCVQLDRSQSRL
ncbi:MAG: PIG-L family deacetylase [Rhodanobacter sp.]